MLGHNPCAPTPPACIVCGLTPVMFSRETRYWVGGGVQCLSLVPFAFLVPVSEGSRDYYFQFGSFS